MNNSNYVTFLNNLQEWNGQRILEPHQLVSHLTTQFPGMSVTDARLVVENWIKTRYQLLNG